MNDTLIISAHDTVLRETGYNFRYNSQSKVVAAFTPYFINNICWPGNINHPVYKEFTAKANALSVKALNKLKIDLKNRPRERLYLRQSLNDTNDIKKCHLELQLVYYLTPNVVNYRNGENIKKYFTLDTSKIIYRLVNGKKLILLVTYRNGECLLRKLNSNDSLSYNLVLFMHHEPILFNEFNIIFSPKDDITALGIFGYIGLNGHILFANSYNSTMPFKDNSPKPMIRTIRREKSVVTAEAFYSNPNASPSVLTQYINRAYDKLISK